MIKGFQSNSCRLQSTACILYEYPEHTRSSILFSTPCFYMEELRKRYYKSLLNDFQRFVFTCNQVQLFVTLFVLRFFTSLANVKVLTEKTDAEHESLEIQKLNLSYTKGTSLQNGSSESNEVLSSDKRFRGRPQYEPGLKYQEEDSRFRRSFVMLLNCRYLRVLLYSSQLEPTSVYVCVP